MRQHFLLVYFQVAVHAASNQGIPKLSLFFTIRLSYSCSSKSKDSVWLLCYSKLWINSLCLFWFSELYFLAVHISEWGSRRRRDNVIPSTLHVSRCKGMKTKAFSYGLGIHKWMKNQIQRKETNLAMMWERIWRRGMLIAPRWTQPSHSLILNIQTRDIRDAEKKLSMHSKTRILTQQKQQSSWIHKTYRTKHTEHTAFVELVEFSLPSSIMNFLCREVKYVST